MTAAPEIKGWCPGALRPMQSGDGLVVRIRPPGGRLSPVQAKAIARAATLHGNGIIDLSARANLQLRGVSETGHGALIEDLRAVGLVDPDIDTETLRNLIVTPFRNAEIETQAAVVTSTLARMPRLPGKFGFALDTGRQPVLATASADIRLERATDGRLILRPDGHPLGKPVTDLPQDLLAMAAWFVANGGITDGRGRMAALVARMGAPENCDIAPAQAMPQPEVGLCADGAFLALAFGQMSAGNLAELAALGHEIRPTPWRMLLLVGARTLPDLPELISTAHDPLLRVTACTGAPGCPQALGPTRALGRSLAPALPAGRRLHVSGCTKGCAYPGPADLTLVAIGQGFDLIRNGSASDTPDLRGVSAAAILDLLKAPYAP